MAVKLEEKDLKILRCLEENGSYNLDEISKITNNTTPEEIGQKLASISGVFAVYYILGDFDFIVIARVKDREDLKRLLREINAIDGVVKTGTHFVASIIKFDRKEGC